MDPDQLLQLLQAMPKATDKPCPTFSTGDATQWLDFRRKYEAVAANNGWTPDQQRAQLGMALEGAAARMVAGVGDLTLAVRDEDAITDYKRNHGGTMPAQIPVAVRTPAQCLDAYEAIFLPRSAGRMAEQLLADAQQGHNENALQWGARLRELFGRARPGIDIQTSREAIMTFIKGIYSTSIKAKLFDADPETFDAAVAKATDKEATAALCRRTTAAGGQALHNMGLGDSEDEEGQGINAKKKPLCWNCHQPGHLRRRCPYPSKEEGEGGAGGEAGKRGRGKKRGGQGRRRPPKRNAKGRFMSNQVSSLAEALSEILSGPTDPAEDDAAAAAGQGN